MGPEIENACVNPVARSAILLENLCFLMEEEGKLLETRLKLSKPKLILSELHYSN